MYLKLPKPKKYIFQPCVPPVFCAEKKKKEGLCVNCVKKLKNKLILGKSGVQKNNTFRYGPRYGPKQNPSSY